MKLPNIRKNLLVQELRDEVLIYDQSTHKSYCLNETAKIVFNACDGEKSVSDLSLPEDIVYLSLDELKKQDLIDDYVSPFAGMNRREVIRKVGLASMIALPVISSLIAPNAANAASADGSCTTDICIPTGQNICAGCAGRTVTIDAYISGSGCTGMMVGSVSRACPANGSPSTSNADVRRTSVQ